MKSPRTILESIRNLVMAEHDADSPTLELAAGVETEIECGKSGRFIDMHGQLVEFDKVNLAELSGRLNPRSLVKIGHTAITTATPNYGSVTKLRYDETRDRLLASIVPTPALVRKNQEEGFTRVSMELDVDALPRGPFSLDHIAMLAVRDPAVTGLKPVALAAQEGEGVYVPAEPADDGRFEVHLRAFDANARKKAAGSGAAMPGGSFPIENEQDLKNAIQADGRASDPAAARAHIRKRAKALGLEKLLPTSWAGAKGLDTDEKVDLDEEENTQMDEKNAAELAAATADRDKQKAENERLRNQLKEGASGRVKAFLAEHNEQIPMNLRRLGLEDGLVALLSTEVEAPITLKFAVSEGENKEPKKIEQTASAFFLAMLAALPPLVSKEEKSEVAKTGVDGDETPAPSGLNRVVKFAESKLHDKTLVRLAEMRKVKPETTYTTALEAVTDEEAAAK